MTVYHFFVPVLIYATISKETVFLLIYYETGAKSLYSEFICKLLKKLSL